MDIKARTGASHGKPARSARRLLTTLAMAMAMALAVPCYGLGASARTYAWETKLQGDNIVLLGDVHDSAVLQHLRLKLLKRALVAGWRPAIAMEQLDYGQQKAIDRARKSRPADANYLIKQATAHRDKRFGSWNWKYFRPYVALALRYHLPLLAANLSRADAEKIVRRGYAAVFDSAMTKALGLDRVSPKLLALQEIQVDEGHCHLMPKHYLPGMARAQVARDALMAAVLRAHAAHGVVLLAGDGHARRDLGVPRYLRGFAQGRVLSVGFLGLGSSDPPAKAFDAVVRARMAPRPDPCIALRRRLHHRG